MIIIPSECCGKIILKLVIKILKSHFLQNFSLLFIVLYYTFLPLVHQLTVKQHQPCSFACKITCEDEVAPLIKIAENLPHGHDLHTCPICTYYNSPFSFFIVNAHNLVFNDIIFSSEIYNNNHIINLNLFFRDYPTRAPPL